MVRKIKSRDKKLELKADIKRIKEQEEENRIAREKARQELGITLEEEKRIMQLMEINRGKGLDDRTLFNRILNQIMREREQTAAEREKKKLEKIKVKALEQVKVDRRDKLSDNKNGYFKIRISDKEKLLIESLKGKGFDVTKELRKLIYKLDKETTREIMGGDFQQVKEDLNNIKSAITLRENTIKELKQLDKTDDILLTLEKEKYLLTTLRRDKKRTEKYFNELKELIK